MTSSAKIMSDEETFQATKDGLENLVAQLGTETDKREHSRFVNNRQLSVKGNEQELNAMYRTDWLIGKAVDIPAEDMTREGWKFSGQIPTTTVSKLKDESDRLGIVDAVHTAIKWARLYGTSFIVMAIDDGLEPDRPVDFDKIRPGGLMHIKVADRHRVEHTQVVPIIDPLDANYGMPTFYRFVETSVVIHHSRVIRFDAVDLPFDEFRRQNYFSDSVIDRIYESVTNFNTGTNASASMIYETNVDIYKVDGLMDYLQTPEGEALIRKRFALSGMLKSFINAQLLDSKEDWMNKTNTFSGLPELIEKFIQILSAATDIPATRLLGISASGFNATGEGDLKNYYDMIKSKQVTKLAPKLRVLHKFMAKSLGLPDDADLSITFNSLFQLTPQEQAEVNFKNAQSAALYVDRQILPEYTVAADLLENGTYANIDPSWVDDLKDIAGPVDERTQDDDDSGSDSDGKSTRPQRLLEEETSEEAPASQSSSKTGSSARG